MTSDPSEEPVDLVAERVIPAPVPAVWDQCTSKRGLESWWSPEDLRTVVKRLDPRPGGEVTMSLRYVPALLGPQSEEAFRAAHIPISFDLRGTFREVERNRRIVLDLSLTLDRAGARVESVTELDLVAEGTGTKVRITVRGNREKHMLSLGKANLEGQLDRLARSLSSRAAAPP
jgi:uncharacterized protein YndB with AHSA1/START domain